ncbi:MAG: HAD family phosphatase [Gemmatimonadota bacterium]|nr:MAG: HAD family phosphatase [Gemmatimonadota bacterium]
MVIFDMDGVLFQGDNFWLDLHREYGTDEEGVKLANSYLNSDYVMLAELVIERLWKGRPASVFERLVESRRYNPGVQEVFEFLHRRGLRSAIVSTGPYQLAERAQSELGIDEIRGNRLIIESGMISQVEIMVRETHKAEVGRRIMSSQAVDPARTAFVGDSYGDVALAELVGLPVAYNSKSAELNDVCKYTLRNGEFAMLIGILENEMRSGPGNSRVRSRTTD